MLVINWFPSNNFGPPNRGKKKAPVKMGRKTPGPKRLGLGESEPFTRSGREAGSAGLQRSNFMTTVCQKSSYHPSSYIWILIHTATDDFFVCCGSLMGTIYKPIYLLDDIIHDKRRFLID